MKRPISVIVVGAGGFGAHYVNILSEINALSIRGVPRIGRLILSRTTLAAARKMADDTTRRDTCCVAEVVGIEIRNQSQLQEALAHYSPYLVCITARDKTIGDGIHPLYAKQALDYNAEVLCEKPFSTASGDGKSLELIRALKKHPNADHFGLELPMAVLGQAMWSDRNLISIWRKSRQVELMWQKQGTGGDLISDLAIHPWSLIPREWQVHVKDVAVEDGFADIILTLHSGGAPLSPKQCRIRLESDGLFRGVRMDDQVWQIRFEKGQLQLWQYSAPWEQVIQGRVEKGNAEMVLAVDNPLLHHISAILSAEPLVDMDRTWESQKFIEDLYTLKRPVSSLS